MSSPLSLYSAVTQEDRVQLTLVLKTLREMLTDRGYMTDEVDWPEARNVRDESDYEKLFMIVNHATHEHSVIVYFPCEAKPGVSAMRQLCERMEDSHIFHALVIVRTGLTPKAVSEIGEMTRTHTESEKKTKKRRKRVECFTYAELRFNITTHEDVPLHVLLTAEEKAAVLERYRAKPTQLPRIAQHDPVARYYGWQRGQVCRIERRSETAGVAITYRIVI